MTTTISAPTARYQVDDEVRAWKRAGHHPGVLAVVDQEGISTSTEAVLRRLGIEVVVYRDPWVALAHFGASPPQAVVVSVRAPADDVDRLVNIVRRELNLPVLLALGDGDIERAATAIVAGACPALGLPLWPAPLLRELARVWVDVPPPSRVIRIGSMELDEAGASAHIDGRHVDLTWSDFLLLWRLAESAGHVVRRDQLWKLWPSSYDQRGALLAAIARLRRKLEPHGSEAAVCTVRGIGYRLDTGVLDGAPTARRTFETA